MKLNDFEKRLLKNIGGLNEKDIRFLLNFYREDEMKRLLDILKNINTANIKNKLKEKELKKLKRLQQLTYEKQCKCNVGSFIIKKIFELKLLNNYDEIIINGTNDLTPKCERILYKIINEMETMDFNIIQKSDKKCDSEEEFLNQNQKENTGFRS